jgi:hypothetical protein
VQSDAPEPVVIVRAVRTGRATPSQWDAWTADGTYLYLRYRWGHGDVAVGDVDGPVIAGFRHGGPWAGDISLEEFCRRAGVVLADGVREA